MRDPIFFPVSDVVLDRPPTERDVIRYRRKAVVEVDGLKVYPDRVECWIALCTGQKVPVSEESIEAARRQAEAYAAKMERFKEFCREDGIDPDTGRKFNPDRGLVEIFQPDAMGYPAHIMDYDPDTKEYL